jgi:hypothetical protein
MCGVVLLQLLLVCVFLCSLHFPPPFVLTFAMGPGSTFHHQKTRQNHFFYKANFSVENKDKEKGKQKG